MEGINAAGLLSSFPRTAYAFAYGSGVFPQPGAPASPSPPMLDVVFAVDDAEAWHAENLARNPQHYTWLARAAGAAAISCVQNSAFGARVWYNAMVPVPAPALAGAGAGAVVAVGAPRSMKYGVITTAALQADLLAWTTLYVAGRLHKPVRRLGCALPPASPLRRALDTNLRSALCAALLSLPARFTAAQLFTAVTALSYTGDWRMALGENPHKVRNIVAGSLPHFHALYAPLLAQPPFSRVLAAEGGGGGFCMDVSLRARAEVGLRLPLRLQRLMAGAGGDGAGGARPGNGRGGALAGCAADYPSARTALREPRVAELWEGGAAAGRLRPALAAIVGAPARGQSLMGVVTAGPAKAAAYAAAKLVKAALGALKG